MATTYDPTTADPGQITKVDRDQLVIDPNVRKDIRLDKSFVSSIRVRGFEQPPVGWQDDAGQVHITMGQRRVSAALEIGWPVVPVIIKPKVDAEGDRAEELRILAQLAENEQRAALNPAETVAAYKQLALFGVSDEQIARKTNSPRSKVDTALAVAASDYAVEVLEAVPAMTLDQAAIITEFDGDVEAVEALTAQAQEDPSQLEHLAARIREDKLDREVIDRLSEEIRAVGATPVTEWSEMPDGHEHLSHLYRADDPERTPLTVDDIPQLSDVIGYITSGWRGDVDRGFDTRWYVVGWKAQGLAQRYTYGTSRADLTEGEKAAQKAERAAKREAKKAMIAATIVRRQWIREVLLNPKRKLDDDARVWIAHSWIGAPGTLRPSDHLATLKLAGELLDLPIRDQSGYENGDYVWFGRLDLAASASALPELVTFAIAIAQTECVVGNEKGDWFGRDTRAARYLGLLAGWGYTLAEIEQAIVDAGEGTKP